MIIGVLGLTAGLAAGGLILFGALGYTLQRSIDTEALRTADTIVRLAEQDALPDPLPVAGGQSRVQVIDDQGRVLAASIDADRLVPMLPRDQLNQRDRGDDRGDDQGDDQGDQRDRGGQQRTFVPGQRLGLDGPVRVVAVPAGTPTEPLTVLVGKSMADVSHSMRVVQTMLLIAFPLLVAGIAVVAWRVLGATLRPVEQLRRGAAEITGGASSGRLPVPASRDEIHRLAVTLNDMLDRLADARARQRAFVADAAHELRSPLTNMRTELEVAQRLADRTDWPAVAGNLLTDTERLSRLVDDLLLLARLDETGPAGGPFPAAGGPFPAAGGAGPVGGSFPAGGSAGPVGGSLPAAGRTGPVGGSFPAGGSAGPVGASAGWGRGVAGPVELGALLTAVARRYPTPPVRVAPVPEPLWTLGDPDDLTRILANLIDNAVRHAHREVVLAAVPADSVDANTGRAATVGSGAYHLVTVTDDGPGIPEADRERVFDRFTRRDDARARDAGGAGLGLAIVRELVRRSGGTIELTTAGPTRAPAPDAAGPDAAGPDAPGPDAAGPGVDGPGADGPGGVGPGLQVRLFVPVLPDPDLDG
ncbi:ATP-binding protein [Micromonospora yangpuensis]|nr:ATP-binding protein [Micromonospora yangpuensis]